MEYSYNTLANPFLYESVPSSFTAAVESENGNTGEEPHVIFESPCLQNLTTNPIYEYNYRVTTLPPCHNPQYPEEKGLLTLENSFSQVSPTQHLLRKEGSQHSSLSGGSSPIRGTLQHAHNLA
jgi:hypothetical protein